MARLLDKPNKQKLTKSELAGRAHTKARLSGMLSIKWAADYLMSTNQTIQSYVDCGFIDAVAIGPRTFILEAELERIKGLLQKYGGLAKAYRASKPNEVCTGDDHA